MCPDVFQPLNASRLEQVGVVDASEQARPLARKLRALAVQRHDRDLIARRHPVDEQARDLPGPRDEVGGNGPVIEK